MTGAKATRTPSSGRNTQEDRIEQTFRVKAVWDAQAEVFYSESDIEGLHIEAATLDEFEAILLDVAPELIMVNHRNASYTLRSS